MSLWQRNRNDFVQWWLSACLGALCSRLLGRKHLTHQTQRINPNPALHYLKMQVVSRGIPRAAYITYNLPCRYRFPCGNGSLRHVGVPRGQARAVIQQHLIAVAVVPAADQHRAAVGSEDGCALRRGNICAAMPGIAESVHFPEVAGYISVSRQRPAQLAISNGGPTAQSKQTGAHFLG